jgi:hypothetical protein
MTAKAMEDKRVKFLIGDVVQVAKQTEVRRPCEPVICYVGE